MRRKLVFLLLLIVLMLSFSYYYISGEGTFTVRSKSFASEELISKEKVLYYGYGIRWEGIGGTKINEIKFIRRDGTFVEGDESEFTIQPFLAPRAESEIGLLSEERVLEHGLNSNLTPVNGNKVKKDLYLVLRVEFDDTVADNDVHTIRIIYSKYGRTNTQDIPLKEGLVTDS